MGETPNIDRRDVTANNFSGAERTLEVEAWFVREVLPLEAVLIQFLNRSGCSKADIEDLRQDVYMRVCAAAYKEIPNLTRPLVFTIARNLLIDQVRHEQVVPIDAVENLDVLSVAIDERTPDRSVIAREELRKLQAALEKLPDRQRTVITLQRIDGLSTREITERTGIPERTVRWSLNEGMRTLAELMLREPADIRRTS